MITTKAPSEAAKLSAKTSTLLPELIVESQEAVEKNLSSRLEKDLVVQVETIDNSIDSLKLDHSSTGEETKTEDASSEQNKDSSLNANMMERLALAIEQAMLSPQTEANVTDKRQHINFSFDDETYYVIPWNACGSWQTMEVFLKEWFKDDNSALEDIANGKFELHVKHRGRIHPRLWEYTLQVDWSVYFLLPFTVTQAPESPIVETEQVMETKYESRLQYAVNYYQTDRWGDGNIFIGKTTYDEPVEFETINENEKLPAIEERKEIISPYQEDPPRREKTGKGTKARLGKLDYVSKTSLMINSPFVLNVLRYIIEFPTEAPTGDQEGLARGIFYHPFKDLYHHIGQLRLYMNDPMGLRAKHSKSVNETCDQHVDLLLQYLESQPDTQITRFERKLENTPATVSFADVWLLLKPGIDMYVREPDGSLTACVVDKVIGGIERPKEDESKQNSNYVAILWYLAYNGDRIVRKTRRVEVNLYDNSREVTALPLFPARFQDDIDDGTLREKLIARGKKYFQYSKCASFLGYTGKGLKRGSRTYKQARVVVEHESAPWMTEDFDLQWHMSITGLPDQQIGTTVRHPYCDCKECRGTQSMDEIYPPLKFSDYDNIDPKTQEELSLHQYLLLPSHMYAFILKDRAYDLVEVDGLEEPRISETTIDRLVMEQHDKDMIKAIAKTYTDRSQSGRFSADFIHGKGEGQIILLHGPPGTGKTLTAESVAEYTRRPLLSITAADLGHEPEALERSLLRYFKDANDWDAIVLLDEADVYLEQRSKNDLKRNSIVSVFLRALDYFQGILFLTTNRVGHFDEAFMSRIHLSLSYKKLDDNARDHIWDNLFRKLREDHEHGGQKMTYEYDAKQYVKTKDVRQLEWNGREIRNAFQTAVALAVFDSKNKKEMAIPEVTENHLQQVVKMSSAFRTYMKAAHSGMDDSVLAFKHGNREDNFHRS